MAMGTGTYMYPSGHMTGEKVWITDGGLRIPAVVTYPGGGNGTHPGNIRCKVVGSGPPYYPQTSPLSIVRRYEVGDRVVDIRDEDSPVMAIKSLYEDPQDHYDVGYGGSSVWTAHADEIRLYDMQD